MYHTWKLVDRLRERLLTCNIKNTFILDGNCMSFIAFAVELVDRLSAYLECCNITQAILKYVTTATADAAYAKI
jgi:hypothetical protein